MKTFSTPFHGRTPHFSSNWYQSKLFLPVQPGNVFLALTLFLTKSICLNAPGMLIDVLHFQ
jgi:hypothetical protein